MKTIYKYTLPIRDRVELPMKAGADILTVQDQDGVITVWAAVDTEEKEEKVPFRIIGTGNPIPEGDLGYVGTVQTLYGKLVWHVFMEL